MSLIASSRSILTRSFLNRGNNNYRQQQQGFTSPLTASTSSEDGTLFTVDTRRQTAGNNKQYQHLYVLPVLFLEFMSLALTRAVLPSLLLEQYGNNVYLVMGCADCIRGFLAFVACPIFGKISDILGRRLCLFVTVLGTVAPVCSLALFPWGDYTSDTDLDDMLNVTSLAAAEPKDESATSGASFPIMWVLGHGGPTPPHHSLHPSAIPFFVILLSISGIFSSTFTLVFAYISDTVRERDERVSAYGLALATFGLSFTIGPMAGGYLAQYNTQHVFISSFVLAILDLFYIYFVLPESREEIIDFYESAGSASKSVGSLEQFNISWNPYDTVRIIAKDPFLRLVGQIAFLYYTGLWAIISTLSVYAVKRFHLGPERLGELMSALGLCTMVAEAVLVRIMVPMLGEKDSMKVGLISFALQCIILGLSFEGWHLFVCAAFSLLGNLVYPSLSSLVSGSVEPESVGEALGAVNGVKALTEGIGPLVFGTLMTISEHSALPGWPYLLAAVLIAMAYKYTDQLPDSDDYIHELDRKKRNNTTTTNNATGGSNHRSGFAGAVLLQRFIGTTPVHSDDEDGDSDEAEGEEFEGLLSEIDTEDETTDQGR